MNGWAHKKNVYKYRMAFAVCDKKIFKPLRY